MSVATPVRFMWNNLGDAGTWTATDAATGFSASNVKTGFRQQRWRSANVTGDKYLTVDLGATYDLTCAILSDHNLTVDAAVVLQGSTNGTDWTTVSTPTITRTDNSLTIAIDPIIVYFASAAYRYVRWKLTDAANPDAYIAVGRVFIGTYSQASKNYQYPWEIAPISLSAPHRALNGVVIVNRKPTYRVFAFGFKVITAAQKDAIRQIVDYCGTHLPMFVDLAPDSTSKDLYAVYGRMPTLPKFSNTRWVLWDLSVQIEEAV
jgi:hypothetical protein